MTDKKYTLGIDIGSTTVKIAILDEENQLLFADYERHFANIQETLAHLLGEAHEKLGELTLQPVITGSGGLALANHLGIPFTQEVIAVSTSLKALAPQTDVAIELGGEDAKIIYFEGGNVEQRMNGICAGGTGSFIDQMASLLQTDATGLNEYAKHYQAIYPIAARCGVFAKTDIQPLINDGATKEDLSASIFQAVVNQTISGLACGKPIRGHVAFLGGPLHFLDQLKAAGKDVIAVGKIQDIFVGKGITEHVYTSGNAEGIERTLEYLDKDFEGLCFINLVDYDMLYGHRRDVDGYAKALAYFDEKLPEIQAHMKPDDILMITADHGCDPAYTATTDHTREYTPFLMYGAPVTPGNRGTRPTFSDIGATVLDYFGIQPEFEGSSVLKADPS